MQRWDYLVIADTESHDGLALPSYLKDKDVVISHWSIMAPADVSSLSEDSARRASSKPATFPPGWSPTDSTGLSKSVPPSDVEFSLALSATPLGSSKQATPKDLKSFITDFGTPYTGPVSMFNVIACKPAQRQRFYGYVAAFSESIGSRYGVEAQSLGAGVQDWSSRRCRSGLVSKHLALRQDAR